MKDKTQEAREAAIAALAAIVGLTQEQAERLASRVNAVNRLTDSVYRAQQRAERGIAQTLENAREEEADAPRAVR